MSADPELDSWLAESRAWAEAGLARALERAAGAPPLLEEALRYAVEGGGKRLRPAVVRLVGRALGAGDDALAPPAVALELVHTYSLVHDDLPCMDDDDLRRGRPTVHVAYDEATAVLVGDALLTLAFEELSAAPGSAARLCGVLARAAGAAGMVGGQVLDLMLPGDARLPELVGMHARKTAELFGAAAEMGAVAAEAGDAGVEAARAYGLALGLCFQATDDLLDVTGDEQTLGKTPGKDARLARTTLVSVLGVEGAAREAERRAEEARAAALRFGGGPLAARLVDRVLFRKA